MSQEQVNDPYGALRFRDFRLFSSVRFLMTVAIQMQSVVIGWQLYEYTKDPLSLGLMGLAEAIPFMTVALFAGYVADRVSRKKIIIVFTGVLTTSVFLLYYLTSNAVYFAEHFTLIIYTVIAVTGLSRGFLGPSFSSFLSQLVPRTLYANASTWNSTVWQIGAVTGPAIGGLIYGFSGPDVAYILAIILLVICFFLVVLIPARPVIKSTVQEPFIKSLSAGLRFVFKNQILLGALSLDLFAVFFGGAIALLPVFAKEVLNSGPEALGFLRAAPAVGAIIMALILVYRPVGENAGKKLLWNVAAFGVCMILFALSTNVYLSFMLLVAAGAVDNVSVVIRSTILQLSTPDEMRGRVSAVNSLFIGSSNEIGAFESGMAAKLLGLVPSVFFGGSMTMIIAYATGRVAPKLKKLNLKELI